MPAPVVRPAVEAEAPAIRALVLAERLNPHDLDWRRFLVAHDGTHVVGAIQLRHHADGSHELGSLVVHPGARGHNLSARLIEALLARAPRTVHRVTSRRMAARYARWDFRPLAPAMAPYCVRRNYRIGGFFAAVIPLLRLERLVPLVILARAGTTQSHHRNTRPALAAISSSSASTLPQPWSTMSGQKS